MRQLHRVTVLGPDLIVLDFKCKHFLFFLLKLLQHGVVIIDEVLEELTLVTVALVDLGHVVLVYLDLLQFLRHL